MRETHPTPEAPKEVDTPDDKPDEFVFASDVALESHTWYWAQLNPKLREPECFSRPQPWKAVNVDTRKGTFTFFQASLARNARGAATLDTLMMVDRSDIQVARPMTRDEVLEWLHEDAKRQQATS